MANIEYQKYVQREELFNRAPYDPEISFYNHIQNGDLDDIMEGLKEPFHKRKGFGILSSNEMNHFRYHFVITTAMIARKCIEAGMSLSDSYNISDYYINEADKAKTPEEISSLHRDMCINYTKRMKSVRKASIISKQVSRCVDYILDNLHRKLTLEELAEVVSLNKSYLSRLFSKEMGMSISSYIQEKRLETAKEMLAAADYPISELATTLGFTSQSYFTKIFKEHNGTTPVEYRNKHYRDTFNKA